MVFMYLIYCPKTVPLISICYVLLRRYYRDRFSAVVAEEFVDTRSFSEESIMQS